MKKLFLITIGVLVFALIGLFAFFKSDGKTLEEKEILKPNQVIIPAENKRKAVEASGKKKLGEDDSELFNLQTSLIKKDASFLFEITNTGDRAINLQYTTSQTFDYEIYKKDGALIQRFSDGKSFLQVKKDVSLPKNESTSFEIPLPTLEKGEYRIVVWSTAKGLGELREKQNFTVE